MNDKCMGWQSSRLDLNWCNPWCEGELSLPDRWTTSSHHLPASSLTAASFPADPPPSFLLNSFFLTGLLSRVYCSFLFPWPPPKHPTRPLTGRCGQSNGHTTAQPIHFTLCNNFKVKFMQSDGRKGRDTYLCGRNMIFRFLDDDEWIHLPLMNLYRPRGSCVQAADDGSDALVACARVFIAYGQRCEQCTL